MYKHLDKPSGAAVERGKDDCERNANDCWCDGQLPFRGALVSDTQSLVARCQVGCGYGEVLVSPEFHVF